MKQSLQASRSLASSARWGLGLAAIPCLLGIAAPARAVVVSIDLTSAGSNSLNITGNNGGPGVTGDGVTANVNNLFPNAAPGEALACNFSA